MRFLKYAFIAFLLLSGPVIAAEQKGGLSSAGQPVFLSALQDIPLPPGAREVKEQTTVFDKPEGRFVEAMAEIHSSSREEVYRFYADSLPQLGWKSAGKGHFRRESEALTIDFESLEGRNYVRFTLSPAK